MRRVLYLEPIGGIAGDMFMAAAIDLGVSPSDIERALAGLPLPPWRLRVSRATRHGIAGTHVDVEVDQHPHPHARRIQEIRAMIDACRSLSPRARERAQRIFAVISAAEARVHGTSEEDVHLHEIGAVDSIVDVCGAAAVLDLLGDPDLLSAPPPLGSGTVQTAHGPIPIPGPATLEILRDVPVRFDGKGELTTPTGASILKALARVGPAPELRVERIGYGVGTREMADIPNVLRASLATADEATDQGLWMLETNLDDSTPQLIGAVMERVLQAGALDAFVTPVVMKKGRPGHLLSVLAPGSLRDALSNVLFSESTTLGVRFHRMERLALERR
ncbi:MAG TPA: nickel pincer cofactor biosynthesis protein LarC, partial [Myxococcaceae bacterium]|nr:nickel pincer cofactor biosynthesis protein LarC [Myxococcaceae bacterium]